MRRFTEPHSDDFLLESSITVKIPPKSLLSPSRTAAVCGGNVLTSQRIVDVVLKAFHAAAASQGCTKYYYIFFATYRHPEPLPTVTLLSAQGEKIKKERALQDGGTMRYLSNDLQFCLAF